MARIAELRYYPIKSCAGVPASEARLTPAGLAHDREFLVIDPDGRARTQRRDPRLATISPRVGAGGRELEVSAPGAGRARVVVDLAGPRRAVTMFGDGYGGIDQGDAIADWITEVIGAPSRLVRVPPEQRRVTDGELAGTSAYADSCAVHLLSSASLLHLNALVLRRGGRPVPMDRFRPNIVVDGWPEPHREDDVRRLTAGDVELGYAKSAIRCAITAVDQRTGARAGPEPLRTLSGYRRVDGGGVAFGAKFVVLRPGALAVGDEVAVTVSARAAGALEQA